MSSTPPDMGHPLAFCQDCGLVFEVWAISFKNNLELHGCSIICPRGHLAEILDGTYVLTNGVISVLGATKFTARQVMKLNALKAKAREMAMRQPDALVPEDFKQSLQEIFPGFGGVLSLVNQGKIGWALLLAILTIAISRCGEGPLIEINLNENNYYVDGSQEAHHPSQQEDAGGADAPRDGTETENGERDGAGDVEFRHVSSFRSALLRTTLLQFPRRKA